MGTKKQKTSATTGIALQNQVDALQNQVTVLNSSTASIQTTLKDMEASLSNLVKSSVSHTHRFSLESTPGQINEQIWNMFLQSRGLNPDGTPMKQSPPPQQQPLPVQPPKKPTSKKKSPKKKKKDDK